MRAEYAAFAHNRCRSDIGTSPSSASVGVVAGEDAFVILLVEGDDAGGAEFFAGGAAGGEGHGVEAGFVAEESYGGGGHGFDVAYGEEQAVGLERRLWGWFDRQLLIVDEFGDAAYAGGDGGDGAGHGFECGEAEGLHLGGHEHEVGEGE